jgi:diaminopimelate decarboxylase
MTDIFHYSNGELLCEDVPIAAIAESVGTPAYIYSKASLLQAFDEGKFEPERVPDTL